MALNGTGPSQDEQLNIWLNKRKQEILTSI